MSAVVGSQPGTDRPPMRVKRKRWTAYILPVFTVGMIIYLASPIFIMILFSFNKLLGQRQIAKFTCCTLTWWQEMFAIPALNEALRTSILVAIPAAIVATALGTLVGLVLGRYSFRGRGPTNFVIFLAIAIPEIVLASSLLSMFVLGKTPIGYGSILFSHIGFSIAFVAITVRARVSGLDRSLENAAQDLFATPFQSFMKVTMPLILPGVVAGFLLSFVLSLDDFVITDFVGGAVNTFPTWVFGATRIGVPPQVNVWGTILFVVGIAVASLNLVGSFRASRRSKAATETAGAELRAAAGA
jgi:spermidine/putrescine transport system permease protein